MPCCGKARRNFQNQVNQARMSKVPAPSPIPPQSLRKDITPVPLAREERIKLRQEKIRRRAERIAQRKARIEARALKAKRLPINNPLNP